MTAASGCCFAAGIAAPAKWISFSAGLPMPRSQHLADDELAQLEHLIEVPDPDLYAALTGNVALAPEYASALFDRIKSFRWRITTHEAARPIARAIARHPAAR